MGSPTRVALTSGTGSLVASQIISAVGVSIQEISCTNTSGGTLYCQVFDSATLPADSTTPDLVFAVPATSTAVYDNQQGVPFASGCVVCISSTAHTKTIGSAVAVFSALTES